MSYSAVVTSYTIYYVVTWLSASRLGGDHMINGRLTLVQLCTVAGIEELLCCYSDNNIPMVIPYATILRRGKILMKTKILTKLWPAPHQLQLVGIILYYLVGKFWQIKNLSLFPCQIYGFLLSQFYAPLSKLCALDVTLHYSNNNCNNHLSVSKSCYNICKYADS